MQEHDTLSDTSPAKKLQGEAARLGKNAAYRNTPGLAYVAEYLSAECDVDASWVIEAVNKGELIACPRCHFLHLPVLAFPLDDKTAVPPGACDVCAYVPVAATFGFYIESMEKQLTAAAEVLQDERDRRAETLYVLWIGRVNAADALLWAAMAAAVQDTVAATEGIQKGGAA